MALASFPYQKGALLIPSGPADKKHLYMILTDSCADSKHLLISISSIKPERFFDDSCVIEPGEHAFIRHASYVLYSKPEIYSRRKILQNLERWYFSKKDDVSDELFKKIVDGFYSSEFIPKLYLTYFEKNFTK